MPRCCYRLKRSDISSPDVLWYAVKELGVDGLCTGGTYPPMDNGGGYMGWRPGEWPSPGPVPCTKSWVISSWFETSFPWYSWKILCLLPFQELAFLLKLNYLPDFHWDFDCSTTLHKRFFFLGHLCTLFPCFLFSGFPFCLPFVPSSFVSLFAAFWPWPSVSLCGSLESSAAGCSFCSELSTRCSAGGSSTGWVPGLLKYTSRK